jgi:paraquat-inducible protein B
MNKDDEREAAARTRTEVRRGWWPGWIWAIPIAAVLLVAWWALRTVFSGGETVTITFDDAHGMKKSQTKVMFRGMQVGEVNDVELSKDGRTVIVTAQIQDAASQFLTTGTQFWLRGAEPSLSDPASLSSVLSGPTLMMDPGPGDKTDKFTGLVRAPVVPGNHAAPVVYTIRLQGAVGGLSPGEPVKLRGFTVGDVKTVGFRYDGKSGRIETPVTLALYPSLFHVDGEPALKATVAALIQHGMHAQLERDPPVVGSPEVSLDLPSGDTAPPASPQQADALEIPASSGGGLESIVAQVNKVPVEQIAQNVLDVTRQADALVASPNLKDAISQLDGALAQIRATADKTGPEVSDLVAQLQKTAGQLDQAVQAVERTAKTTQQTAAAADNLLGGTQSQNDAQTTLREIRDAARSVRELADYLNRDPDALIRGRSGP